MKKCDMVVDLQFGSTGKGLIVGYLAETRRYEAVVTANMPNAGHTYIDRQGRKFIHKVLPNGIVSPALKYIMIGPGAIFDPDRLEQELTEGEQLLGVDLRSKLMIHPNAVVLDPSHKAFEQAQFSSISSTMQGSAAAMWHKIRRDPENSPIACHSPDLGVMQYVCSHQEWREALEDAESILAEGSQGYSLGINTEFYPYTTSRDCTPTRFLSDMAIPLSYLRHVVGTARTYPIRVGNTSDGYSGPHYSDQSETTWEELGQVPELTTVTKRVRRVFTFSMEQIKEACFYCCPDSIFLNFANYLAPVQVPVMVQDIFEATGVRVDYIGSGPTFDDIDERGPDL